MRTARRQIIGRLRCDKGDILDIVAIYLLFSWPVFINLPTDCVQLIPYPPPSRRHDGRPPNSRYIYIWRSARTQGWFGGMLLVSEIAGMMMFPKSNIRTGDFEKEDIANFPPHLKRLLKIDTAMLIGSIVWFLAANTLLECR